MNVFRIWSHNSFVALLAEGVGRNGGVGVAVTGKPRVALLAEGVGRNIQTITDNLPNIVALLAEGVGRNAIIRAGYGKYA